MRLSEWILAGYFTYTTLLSLLLPVRPGITTRTLLVNTGILALYTIVAYARPGPVRQIVRDWLPLPLMLLAYKEMGWFAPSHHTFELELRWIVWDRLLLREWRLRAAIESLGPLLPSLLEISYLLVYSVPVFCMTMLYVYSHRERADAFLTIFMLGIFLSYIQFPFWPSEPPRVVFPGEDAPEIYTIFRKWNLKVLGGYGIHTSVFPSAHVSGAFSAAFAMMRLLPERRWVGRFLLVLAVMIATATVYGRYHYAVDTLAGFAVAVAAYAIGVAALSARPSQLRLPSA